MARWITIPYQQVSGKIYVAVIAGHVNGIDKVRFVANDGTATDVSTPIKYRSVVNSQFGYQYPEYDTDADSDVITDSDIAAAGPWYAGIYVCVLDIASSLNISNNAKTGIWIRAEVFPNTDGITRVLATSSLDKSGGAVSNGPGAGDCYILGAKGSTTNLHVYVNPSTGSDTNTYANSVYTSSQASPNKFATISKAMAELRKYPSGSNVDTNANGASVWLDNGNYTASWTGWGSYTAFVTFRPSSSATDLGVIVDAGYVTAGARVNQTYHAWRGYAGKRISFPASDVIFYPSSSGRAIWLDQYDNPNGASSPLNGSNFTLGVWHTNVTSAGKSAGLGTQVRRSYTSSVYEDCIKSVGLAMDCRFDGNTENGHPDMMQGTDGTPNYILSNILIKNMTNMQGLSAPASVCTDFLAVNVAEVGCTGTTLNAQWDSDPPINYLMIHNSMPDYGLKIRCGASSSSCADNIWIGNVYYQSSYGNSSIGGATNISQVLASFGAATGNNWYLTDAVSSNAPIGAATGSPGAINVDTNGIPQVGSLLAGKISVKTYPTALNLTRYSMVSTSAIGAFGALSEQNTSPTVAISSPSTGATYIRPATVTLTGSGTDTEDGTLPGASLLWVSDIDGPLGSGTTLPISNLSYGKHTITLTGSDSMLASGTATIVLYMNTVLMATPDYYVCKTCSGANDSNAGTSWATCLATIQGGVTKAGTAGGTKVIGVAPDIYDSEANSRVVFGSTQTGDNITVEEYTGVDAGGAVCPNAANNGGAAAFSSTASNSLWLNTSMLTGSVVWDGIDIETSNSSQMVNFDASGTTSGQQTASLTIKNCELVGYVYLVDDGTPTGTARDVTFDSVTFSPPSGAIAFQSIAAHNITFTNCAMARTGGTDAAAAYFNFGSASSSLLNKAIIDTCQFGNSAVSTVSLVSAGNLAAGTIIVKNSTLEHTSHALNVPAATTGTVRLLLTDSTIRTVDTGQTGATIYNVVIGSPEVDTSSKTMGPPIIRNCTFEAKGSGTTNSPVLMMIGPEAAGAEIAHNTVRGHNYWTGANEDLGIYVRGAINCNVHHNDIFCRGGLVNVRGNGTKYQHNTVYSTTGTGTNGATVFIRDENGSGTTDTLNIVFTDNIVMAGSSVDYIFSISPHDVGNVMDVTSWVVDRNLFYKAGSSSGAFCWKNVSKTWAEWTALWRAETGIDAYNDLNSLYADPKFKNIVAGDLKLTIGSPAKGIQTGAGSAATWNDLGAYQRKSIPGQQSFVGDNP